MVDHVFEIPHIRKMISEMAPMYMYELPVPCTDIDCNQECKLYFYTNHHMSVLKAMTNEPMYVKIVDQDTQFTCDCGCLDKPIAFNMASTHNSNNGVALSKNGFYVWSVDIDWKCCRCRGKAIPAECLQSIYCNIDMCPMNHSNGRICKSNVQIHCNFGIDCRRESCYYKHCCRKINLLHCMFKKNCTRPDCYYSHPDGRLIDGTAFIFCRSPNCADENCMYLHQGYVSSKHMIPEGILVPELVSKPAVVSKPATASKPAVVSKPATIDTEFIMITFAGILVLAIIIGF
jgi:hypothetical protein